MCPSPSHIQNFKLISPIPAGSIDQMFNDAGPPKNTATHQILQKGKGFSYCNILGELIYVYITNSPGIGYVITTLSKLSSMVAITNSCY